MFDALLADLSESKLPLLLLTPEKLETSVSESTFCIPNAAMKRSDLYPVKSMALCDKMLVCQAYRQPNQG